VFFTRTLTDVLIVLEINLDYRIDLREGLIED